MTRLLLVLGLSLALGTLAKPTDEIIDEYGFCPRYEVKEGDTLFEIAKKLKLDQTNLTASATACGLDLALLQIGSDICLPGYDMTLCEDIVRTDPDRPYCQVYVVAEGDTTASVAQKFNLTEEELVDLNSDYLDDGYTLPVAGQYVRIPGWNQRECRDFNDNDRPMCQMYTVQAADTARDIAQKYKVDLEEMLELNELNATDLLPLNLKLKLPKWNDSCPEEGVPAVLPSDTVDCRVTILGDGEALAFLADEYMTTLKAMLAVNPALVKDNNASLLQPGTYINIPPFPASCVGNGQLVDVPTGGNTTLPADYDYNGLVAAPPSSSPTAAPSPATAATPSPAATPTTAEPTAAPAPAPVPSPSSGAAPAAASLLAAVLALLAGALAL